MQHYYLRILFAQTLENLCITCLLTQCCISPLPTELSRHSLSLLTALFVKNTKYCRLNTEPITVFLVEFLNLPDFSFLFFFF